ncbi:MAG: DUF1045 domain-containing protein [Pseudomonadota bacterium]
MRYAIYYTPVRDHPLTQAAANWLGRDAFGHLGHVDPHGFDHFVSSPRRYGFHGTLKAPFRLAQAVTEDELVEAFDAFLARPRQVPNVMFEVGELGAFLALVPQKGQSDDLALLARDCLVDFEPFRAPLTDAEIERRKPNALSENQRAHLHRYGYPYVLDEFRFHMTLSNAVDDETKRQEMLDLLVDRFAPLLVEPLAMNALAIFVEREPGADFEVLQIGELTAADK